MFDLFLKPKFYTKSKSALRVNKVRLDTIKKKRNAVEKYLKKDIADLLRNGLDYNAYLRTEGLLVEQTRTTCYKFIEQFSECISKQVSVMQKQSECPDECREAVPSLIYAAARFSDLPELRTLRTLFTEKYGSSLEPYLNKQFAEKILAEPPTKEMKLQLMHDIAREFSIQWDSKALEQKLFKPPPPEQNEARDNSLNEGDDGRFKSYRNTNDAFLKSSNHDDNNNGSSNMTGHRRPKRNETDHTSHRRKEVADDKPKQRSSSRDGPFEKSNDGDDENGLDYLQEYRRSKRNPSDLPFHARMEVAGDKKLHSSSDGEFKTSSDSEPFYKFVPPPYLKPSVDISKEKRSTEDVKTPTGNIDKPNDSAAESKPKPRSVRSRRPLKLPPGRENTGL